jgi:hypothetical protein
MVRSVSKVAKYTKVQITYIVVMCALYMGNCDVQQPFVVKGAGYYNFCCPTVRLKCHYTELVQRSLLVAPVCTMDCSQVHPHSALLHS